MKRYLIALILFPILAFAYQSPGKPSGFVNDFAGLLKPETVQSLNLDLTNFEKETGNEISVVTITKLNDETIETYAEKLFQDWGIGKAKQDNGLLLLISKEDREMRIEVGYGLEPVITDIESSHIIQDVLTPAFQRGDFDGGIASAIQRIENDIKTGEPLDTAPIRNNTNNFPWQNFIFYGFIGVIYLSSILGRSKSWWAGGVVGGIIGIVISLIKGFIIFGLLSFVVLIPLGLLFDFLVSKSYAKHKSGGTRPPWWIGGGRGGGGGGFGGGGFGGFGGGMSGGGGSSGRW